MNISSEVLTMYSQDREASVKGSGFETTARAKRYRLLAEASMRKDIPYLFLAHHANDHAETVIMRLADKLGSITGLKGIAPVRPIPHCEDIYGTDPRSQPLPLPGFFKHSLAEKGQYTNAKNEVSEYYDRTRIVQAQESHCEDDGILLLRPLYQHSKDRLIATCKDNNVPYVVDPTNVDPTYTRRNACRHLITTYNLPRALQFSSILNLSKKATDFDQSVSRLSDRILERMDLRFRIPIGALVVRFPPTRELNEMFTDSTFRLSRNAEIAVLTRVLHRLIEVVQPLRANFDIPDPVSLTSFLFNEKASETSYNKNPCAFGAVSIGLVNIRPLEGREAKKFSDGTSETLYFICRRPLNRAHGERKNFEIVNLKDGPHDSKPSKWVLWDGRFWIRLLKATQHSNWAIRALQAPDVSSIRNRFRAVHNHKNGGDEFEQLLVDNCPGKLRYTLPAIVDELDRVRIIPTLGVTVPTGPTQDSPDYEIRYKAVDPFILRCAGHGNTVSE
ncbi:putative pp-loop family protein [Phaeomoniella chlamydospora]|uniref:tRNA(Ile)-lysidine synthetase n=1 Tax=Phaeomoniella chlamydospora TaxID=158046 RepID=A0A0G2F085_PHACM|nr:putative pp-loop family protein [Phaeomoniella chlamydospora]